MDKDSRASRDGDESWCSIIAVIFNYFKTIRIVRFAPFFPDDVIKRDEITSFAVITAIYRKVPCVHRYPRVDFHDAAHGEIASLQK